MGKKINYHKKHFILKIHRVLQLSFIIPKIEVYLIYSWYSLSNDCLNQEIMAFNTFSHLNSHGSLFFWNCNHLPFSNQSTQTGHWDVNEQTHLPIFVHLFAMSIQVISEYFSALSSNDLEVSLSRLGFLLSFPRKSQAFNLIVCLKNNAT